jgi:hypothetical protein
MKTIIHVNQHVIKSNRKHNENEPVLTVKQGSKNTYGHEVIIDGPSRIVYSPDKPLSCGARVWIETEHNVTINGAKKYERRKNKTKINRSTTDIQTF